MRIESLFVKKLTAIAMAVVFFAISSGTHVQAATTPDLTPQQIEAVIEDAFAGLVAFDVPRVVNNFASDAVVEDPVGTPPIVGTQAIADYLATFPTLFSQMKLYSLDIKPGGNEAGVKWRLRFTTRSGHTFFLEGIGHFRLNEQGKIQTEKEFFDLAYFVEQLQK